jgi:hypothetical protein
VLFHLFHRITMAEDRVSWHGPRSPSASKYAETPLKAGEKRYDVFISHCKRIGTTEDRALWIQDTLEVIGLRATFEHDNGTAAAGNEEADDAARRASIRAKVLASRCVVTVLDPEAFGGAMLLENEIASEAGIPIITFFDADTYRWQDVSHWSEKHPSFFQVPTIEYRRAYHKQARQLLIAKAKGEKMSGASASLENPAEVLVRMLRKLVGRIKELTSLARLPSESGEVCRACEELCGELSALQAAVLDYDAVVDAMSNLRDCIEELIELVEDAGQPRARAKPPRGMCCFGGGAGIAVAPEPTAELVHAFDRHVASIGEKRRELHEAAEEAARGPE